MRNNLNCVRVRTQFERGDCLRMRIQFEKGNYLRTAETIVERLFHQRIVAFLWNQCVILNKRKYVPLAQR